MFSRDRDVWFTIKVGQRQTTRKFKARWSWAQEDYVIAPSEFRKVAAELGAKSNEDFNIFNPLN